ncbi:nuclease-related domain-containing protein [Pleurocapsa sp. FMAR1]|uniref:nuclease-related domain-containing protein n=1 Tax=Pleurocapsa sp. FMAR1 TaxID=3040204 RepID=UPI0029C8BD10|nr:nuclease-related domain-containing protein [Pleurocapsa sp. FMAR1]
MPKLGRQAGQNIRKLALKRRMKAVTSFASAGFVFFLPIFLVKTFDKLLRQLSPNNSSQPQSSLNWSPILYVPFIVIALGLATNAVFLWKQANNADQGAEGEESIGKEISQLEHEGWQVEYGMYLGNKLGDADIVCISPQNKAYVIDVKSHKGKVTTDGKQLYRCMGRTKYPFEKDFIAQTMRQALQVKKQKGFNFVTPILAFSDAKVSLPSEKLRKVYVVEKSKLTSLLKFLG